MKTIKISDRHYIFQDDLGVWKLNIHLIRALNNNYIIDTGLGSESIKPILDLIRDDKKPIVVVNTHYHWDHIWGNGCFKDSKIIAYYLTNKLIETNWEIDIKENERFIKGEAKKTLPNHLIKRTLRFPEDHIEIFFAPGHTADGINVYDSLEKVLNVGDNIGDSMDELVPELETSKEIYLVSLNKYKEYDVNYVVSGHNEVTDAFVFDKIIKLL